MHILMVLALAGCHESLGLVGDTSIDATPDTSIDVITDTGADTSPDVGPPDVVPDIVPDGPLCPEPSPEPHGPTISWTVDGTEWPDWIDVSEICDIDSARADEDGLWLVRLTCWTEGGEMHSRSLEVSLGPYGWLPLWEGERVEFRYVTDPIHWVNRWFEIRWLDGDMIVGGMDGSEPFPARPSTFFSPLSISVVGGYCPREASDCYDLERQALYVEYEYGGEALVFDSTIGYVGEWGDYTIMVDEAVGYHEIMCTDIPGGWYTAIMYQSMWD
jgi:hypothetical protein